MISPASNASQRFASLCGLMVRRGSVNVGSGSGAMPATSPCSLRSSSIGPQSSARRARGHARRVLALCAVVGAQVALRHDALFRVELWRGVGARPLAVAAAHALVRVDGDDAVLADVHRGGRTDLGADRVVTVVAGHRCVVGERVGGQLAVGVAVPVAARVLDHAAPVHADRCVVLVLAGDLAGFAAVAQGLVEEETKALARLVVVVSHVVVSLLGVVISLFQPGTAPCAARCPWQEGRDASWSAY